MITTFEKTTMDLKAKWLSFYQDNQTWIKLLSGWYSHPRQGYKIPPSSLILGLITIWESDIGLFLRPLSNNESNPETIIITLELDFNLSEYLPQKTLLSSNLNNQDYLPDFDSLKQGLKEEFLRIYKKNQEWMDSLNIWDTIEDNQYYVKPPFLLGLSIALRPKLKEYFIPLLKTDPNGQKTVKLLDLYLDTNSLEGEQVVQIEDSPDKQLLLSTSN